jgi:hypothetical protein
MFALSDQPATGPHHRTQRVAIDRTAGNLFGLGE